MATTSRKKLERMERRKYGRVRLRIPARVRWVAPFGLHEEVQRTEDLSRGGLKVPVSVSSLVTHFWVSFPYEPELPESQPEMLVRAVRCEPRAGGGAMLAGRFETLPSVSAAGRPSLAERRASRRRPLSIPLRVRPENLPWFEESMTLDVSHEGLRFLSCREYELGSCLLVSFKGTSVGPWNGKGEIRTLVARAEEELGPRELAVSVYRLGAKARRSVRSAFSSLARIG